MGRVRRFGRSEVDAHTPDVRRGERLEAVDVLRRLRGNRRPGPTARRRRNGRGRRTRGREQEQGRPYQRRSSKSPHWPRLLVEKWTEMQEHDTGPDWGTHEQFRQRIGREMEAST